jgi:hypothetical protein
MFLFRKKLRLLSRDHVDAANTLTKQQALDAIDANGSAAGRESARMERFNNAV